MNEETLKIFLEKKKEEGIKYGYDYSFYGYCEAMERIEAMRGSISEEEYNKLMIEAAFYFSGVPFPTTLPAPPAPPVMPKYEGLKDEKTEKEVKQ
jgi:hypothetical protein